MEDKYLQALKLYDEKKYKECSDICVEFIQNANKQATQICEFRKFFVLNLKTLLYRINVLEESQKETFLNYVGLSSSYAETVDDIYDILNQIEAEIDNLEVVYKKEILGRILEKPSIALCNEYLELSMPFLMLKAETEMATDRQKFLEKTSLSLEEADRKYLTNKDEKLNIPNEIHDFLFEVVSSIYKRAKRLLDEADGSVEFVEEARKRVGNDLVVAECLLVRLANFGGDLDEKLHLLDLKTAAEIKDFLLKAKVYPNGQECSVVLSNEIRRDWILTLTDFYSQIKELEPDFIPPELPEKVAVNFIQTTTGSNNSGGCYVATSVYGSYDCPQVWTLRRYRDYNLAESWYGRAFIRIYYAVSPKLVKLFGNTYWFKKMWRGSLDRMVKKLQTNGFESTPYNDRKWY